MCCQEPTAGLKRGAREKAREPFDMRIAFFWITRPVTFQKTILLGYLTKRTVTVFLWIYPLRPARLTAEQFVKASPHSCNSLQQKKKS